MLALLGELPPGGAMLPFELSNDQRDRDDDDDNREQRRAELQLGLRPPIGKRVRHGRGRHDENGEIGHGPDRVHQLLALDHAGEASSAASFVRSISWTAGEDIRLPKASLVSTPSVFI
jgi:hypothetical protein